MRYRFDEFEFSTTNQSLRCHGELVHLRPLSAELLQYLIEQAPEYVSTEELLTAVWQQQSVSTRAVSQTIHELRQVLGGSSKKPRFIETRYRVGYRFVGALNVIPPAEPSPSAPHPANEPAKTTLKQPKSSNKPWWWLGGALTCIALLTLVWFALNTQKKAPPTNHALYSDQHLPQSTQARALYFQAVEAAELHKYAEAERLLHEVLKAEPNNLSTTVSMADVLLRSGNRKEALRWTNAAQKNTFKPSRTDQLRIEALKATAEFDWAQAEAKLQSVFQHNPGDIDIGFRLFDVQLQAGKNQEAQQTLQRLSELTEPVMDPYRLSMHQARLHAARGNHQARLTAAQHAENQAGADLSKRTSARLEQAIALLGLGKKDEAMQVWADNIDGIKKLDLAHLQLKAYALKSQIDRTNGDYDDAISASEKVATLAESLGDAKQNMDALANKAYVLILKGNITDGLALLETLQSISRALNNPNVQANLLRLEALAWEKQGDMEKSRHKAKAAYELLNTTGDQKGIASISNQIAVSYARQSSFKEAEAWFKKSYDALAGLGEAHGKATALSNLAIIYNQTGRTREGKELNEQALGIYQDIDAKADVARLQFNLSNSDQKSGRFGSAQKRMAEALSKFEQMGAEGHRLRALSSLAELHLMLGQWQQAKALLSNAQAKKSSPPMHQAALLTAKGKLALQRQSLESAQSFFEEAHKILLEHQVNDWLEESQLNLAELSAAQRQSAQTIQPLRALRQRNQQVDPKVTLDAGLLLARALLIEGKSAEVSTLLASLSQEASSLGNHQLLLRLRALQALTSSQPTQELQQVAKQARNTQFIRLAWQLEALATQANPQSALNKTLETTQWQGVPTLR